MVNGYTRWMFSHFYKDNCCNYLIAFLCLKPFLKSVYSKKKEFAPLWSKFFPFRVDHFSEGGNVSLKVTFLESLAIPLKGSLLYAYRIFDYSGICWKNIKVLIRLCESTGWSASLVGSVGGHGFDPAKVCNILSWRLIMRYFLRSFSPFHWFKKGSCQFLAKEWA